MIGDARLPMSTGSMAAENGASLRRIAIVVPDGLKASPQRRVAVPEPSFAFRAVLDRVVSAYRTARILLAPGNSFGSGEFEQDVAARYLRDRGAIDVAAVPNSSTSYVDTRGNAILLRRYLTERGDWPLPDAVLVVALPHAKRASYCFRREGFALSLVDPVPYSIPADEPVTYRQWYYAHPSCHGAYEWAALLRDMLRD
jgi:uncharacterized SAM-binding protein YcdF (DUF218 family)